MLIRGLSRLLKQTLEMFLPSPTTFREQSAAKQLYWDTKMYKGVIWNVKGRDDFGNMIVSEKDLTFYKSVTSMNKKIILQVPIPSIHKVNINQTIEDQFNLEMEYRNRDNELTLVSFYVIMDTETEGRDVWRRIQQFRSKKH